MMFDPIERGWVVVFYEAFTLDIACRSFKIFTLFLTFKKEVNTDCNNLFCTI